MRERYLCIHGHFYQPPQENPVTGEVDAEPSADPFHDWNERITAECYAPNARARTLEKISFDFGPTLLAWLERTSPEVYRAVIDADRESAKRFSGHGSAIAMAYNHMILPLANDRDKETQVIWGIRDFEHRFGRFPEGMWLPETAVDIATLEVLAEHKIRFTLLAPHQARSVHKLHDHFWYDVSGGVLDPTMPYLIELPSGRTIHVFLYDEAVSRAVAFEGLLHNGDSFFDRLTSSFSEDRTWPELVHIATDGESYGHHHKFGEMALAHTLKRIEDSDSLRLTNYGEYLSRFSPTHQVEILEKSSWSCAHGIERWRSDCGCRTGTGPGNQAWRQPLREAFDWLRDTLEPVFEIEASEYLKDPWAARDDYIDVLLGKRKDDFFAAHAVRPLAAHENAEVLRLMELQRHLMFMYTSCGWFFDDPAEPGTQIVLGHARRAVDLVREISEKAFRESRLQDELDRRLAPVTESRS